MTYDFRKSYQKNRKLFSLLFIILLLAAESGSFTSKHFATVPLSSPSRNAHEKDAEQRKASFFIKNTGHDVRDDIEINRNNQNLSVRYLSVKSGLRREKPLRKIGADSIHPLGKEKVFLYLWLFKLFAIGLMEIAFTYSLRFIIRYIHFKNGEKIVVSSF